MVVLVVTSLETAVHASSHGQHATASGYDVPSRDAARHRPGNTGDAPS